MAQLARQRLPTIKYSWPGLRASHLTAFTQALVSKMLTENGVNRSHYDEVWEK